MRLRALTLSLVTMLALAPRLAAQDAADAAWQAGDHPRARALYAQRVAADSADIPALHRLGLLLAWNREYADAIRLLDRVIRLQPASPARLDRANVLAWSGRFDAAELAFRDVLEREPASVEGLHGLARVASWRGDLAGGEELWRRALADRPDDVAAHIGLSQVLRWSGRAGAALTEAETAVRLAPDNADAREQLEWARASFRPRFAPSVAAEFDSDDNRLLTTALSASGFVHRRLALSAHGYVRRTDDARPGAETVGSRALSLAARLEVAEGWSVSGGAGVNQRQIGGDDATATYSAGLGSPAWLPVSVSLNAGRHVLDATALLVERGVTIDEASASVAVSASRSLRIEGAAAVARFRGQADNDRVLGRLGLEAKVTRSLRLRPRVTAFTFEDDLEEGYFDPDFYGLTELGIGFERYRSAWSFSGEVAPGAQQIGTDGPVRGALSLRGRIGYTLAPGREVGVSFTFSNLGIERFEANGGGYRYQAALLSAGWAF